MFQKAYCGFCVTGMEPEMIHRIQTRDGLRALSPIKYKTEKRAGVWITRKVSLLPGYVFIYSDTDAPIEQSLPTHSGLKLLAYPGGQNALRGPDLACAEWVYRLGGVIGLSRAVLVGERVKIVDGPLADMAGYIQSVDKRKRIAKIHLDIGGAIKQIWLSFDWLNIKPAPINGNAQSCDSSART